MKEPSRFSRYCGLALDWGARGLKFTLYLLLVLGEVTNYRAKPL